MKFKSFKPMAGKVFVSEIDEGTHITKGGIIITDDLGKDRGIRARWGKVSYIGSDITDVSVGEWVLIEHGRWTQRMKLEIADEEVDLWMIDPDAILLVNDINPSETRIVLGAIKDGIALGSEEKSKPMVYRALHDRVLVRRTIAEGITPGGIIIPDVILEKPAEGHIVTAGNGTRLPNGQSIPLDIKQGDHVMFGKTSGIEVRLDGEDLLIMKEIDIMGVVE